jgi:hypothetical protein
VIVVLIKIIGMILGIPCLISASYHMIIGEVTNEVLANLICGFGLVALNGK